MTRPVNAKHRCADIATTWRYRALERPTDDGLIWEVCEVYTGREGEISWTGAITPRGDTLEELQQDLQKMTAAVQEQISLQAEKNKKSRLGCI